MAKKQKVLAVQLHEGEMQNIDAAVGKIPLASKNGTARAALHYGLQHLMGMDPGEAAKAIEEFNKLDVSKRFTR